LRYDSLADAVAALQRLTGRGLEVGLSSAVRRVATDYLVTNVAKSPVGRFQRMVVPGPNGRRIVLPRDRHPGKARASWRLSVGSPAYAQLPNATQYPVPGAGQAAAALRSYRIGKTVNLTNDARTDGRARGYADVVLLLGRHLDRRNRMIGSLQASRGTVIPTQEEVATRAPDHIAAGIVDGLAAARVRP
jgi:hypothetical protein